MNLKKLTLAVSLVALTAGAAEPLKIGIIGCDTSHAIAFTKLLNVEKDPACNGHRIVAAYKWGSPDIFSSTNRYPKYIAQLKEMGVEMVPSIADLLSKVDAVCLETCDGRPHYKQALEVFQSGKPVFIDKPIAASLADTIRIVEAAKKYNAKFFCSSALRFTDNAQNARAGKFGEIRGADVWTPEQFEPTQSDYYWYAIHGAEPLFTIMGVGCTEVQAMRSETEDVLVGRWKDGRLGVMRAMNYCKKGACYGGMIFPYKGKPVEMGGYEGYKKLLMAILKYFETGVVPFPPEESVEIYAFMEAGAESVRRGGKPVTIEEVLAKARAEAAAQ